MNIQFTPQRRDDPLTVSKAGDVFTVNGQVFDFSALPDGATLLLADVPCGWLASDVERIAGELHFTLIFPCGPNPPPEVDLALPLVNPPDGLLAIPIDPFFTLAAPGVI